MLMNVSLRWLETMKLHWWKQKTIQDWDFAINTLILSFKIAVFTSGFKQDNWGFNDLIIKTLVLIIHIGI